MGACCGCVSIDQSYVGLLERFGEYQRILKPGFHSVFCCGIDKVNRISLRFQQLNLTVETKTSDNVFVKIAMSVQYNVIDDKVYEAYYRLYKPAEQIKTRVEDRIRSIVPTLKLDKLFLQKGKLADEVSTQLNEYMAEYGYNIQTVLITDIEPDPQVKTSMNRINAAYRLKKATELEAEANKIAKIKAAEADAEAQKLAGKGIADSRKAIVEGLRESVKDFTAGVNNASPDDVMNLIVVTQYMDTLKSIGNHAGTKAIFLPHSPTDILNIGEQIRNSLLSANAVDDKEEK